MTTKEAVERLLAWYGGDELFDFLASIRKNLVPLPPELEEAALTVQQAFASDLLKAVADYAREK